MPITLDGNRYYSVTGGDNVLRDTTNGVTIANNVIENSTFSVGSNSKLRFGDGNNALTFRNCVFIDENDASAYGTFGFSSNAANCRFIDNEQVTFENCIWYIHPTGRGDFDTRPNTNVVMRNCTINHLATSRCYNHINTNTTNNLVLDNVVFNFKHTTHSIEFSPQLFVKTAEDSPQVSLNFRPGDERIRAFMLFGGGSNTAQANTRYRVYNLQSPNCNIWAGASTAVCEMIDPTSDIPKPSEDGTRATNETNGVVECWRTFNIDFSERDNTPLTIGVFAPTDGAIMVGNGDPITGSETFDHDSDHFDVYLKQYTIPNGTRTFTNAADSGNYNVRVRSYIFNLVNVSNFDVDLNRTSLDNSITFSADPNISLSETEALALTGININFDTGTITLTEARTLQEIYDYWKAQFVRIENLQYTDTVAWDGNLLDVGDYTINGTEFIRI